MFVTSVDRVDRPNGRSIAFTPSILDHNLEHDEASVIGMGTVMHCRQNFCVVRKLVIQLSRGLTRFSSRRYGRNPLAFVNTLPS